MIHALRRLRTLDALASILGGRPKAGLDWPAALALATELDVRGPLWAAVADHRIEAPAAVAEELREFARGNTVRNVRLRQQLREAIAALNEAGVEPLLLKGAPRLLDGSLPRLGERWLNDLDLLVPAEAIAAASGALAAVGYRPEAGDRFLPEHEVPLVRSDRPVPLELHRDAGMAPLTTVLPTAEVWEHSAPLALDGLRARRPDPTDQVLHNVLHSALQDFNHEFRGLPLRQLADLVSLARALGDSVDWDAVHARLTAEKLEPVLLGHLWLAHRYAGLAPVPAAWWRPERRHELQVRAAFALGWPADLRRNLRYAFGARYLDGLYHHGGRPAHLALARARHAARLLHPDRRSAALREARRRRN